MNNRRCSLTIIKLASQNIHNFMKVLSRNIYFGTEFKKSLKLFATKVWSYTVSVNIGKENYGEELFLPIFSHVPYITITAVIVLLNIPEIIEGILTFLLWQLLRYLLVQLRNTEHVSTRREGSSCSSCRSIVLLRRDGRRV